MSRPWYRNRCLLRSWPEPTPRYAASRSRRSDVLYEAIRPRSRLLLPGRRFLDLSPDIPRNSGVWRAVTVIAPEGSLLNPTLPAAVAGRGLTLSRTMDVIMGAEAGIAPDRIPACEMGSDFLLCMGFLDEGRTSAVLVETIWGGWGGRPSADGIDFNTPVLLDGSNQSCELNEALYPILYRRYSYVPDTEGAGKHRGSLALVRDWELTAESATCQIRTDRTRTQPWGLYGGQPGAFARTTLCSNGATTELGKVTVGMRRGDVLSVQVAGAGGWGDPLERNIELVRGDVIGGKVSPERAQSVYGVVVDTVTLEVDVAATQALRKTMRPTEFAPLFLELTEPGGA